MSSEYRDVAHSVDPLLPDQIARLNGIDLHHLWHPFTQHQVWNDLGPPLIVDRAEGCELFDLSGRRYLDGVSSLWCNVHGHGVTEIVEAIRGQALKLCHSTLLGLSHRPILELTDELLRVVPRQLTRFFYCDSGSAAVEAALRMVIEWWQKQSGAAAKRRKKLVSLHGSYHGDTLGAVRVGYDEIFHGSLRSLFHGCLRVKPPHLYRLKEQVSEEVAVEAAVAELRRLLERKGDEIAGMIVEPLVQGAAGIWVHPVEYLRQIAALCRKFDILFVVDEVATGFGKTGTMFASQQLLSADSSRSVGPDIMVVGKGLSGGYLPISAAIATEEIFSGFVGDPAEYKTFFFGQTFAGNPLGAAASIANLRLFHSTELLSGLGRKITLFHQLLDSRVAAIANVYEVRRCGLMIGIEFTDSPGRFSPYPVSSLVGVRVVQAARRRGVVIRPLGNVMVLMPSLVISESELAQLVDVTADSIEEVIGELQ